MAARIRHFSTFGLVSAVCALVNFVVVVCLTKMGLHYVVSLLASFAICIVLGYLLHAAYTFSVSPDAIGFGRYSLAMSINLPGSIFFLWLSHDVMGLGIASATIMATALLTCLNYLLGRWAIRWRS